MVFVSFNYYSLYIAVNLFKFPNLMNSMWSLCCIRLATPFMYFYCKFIILDDDRYIDVPFGLIVIVKDLIFNFNQICNACTLKSGENKSEPNTKWFGVLRMQLNRIESVLINREFLMHLHLIWMRIHLLVYFPRYFSWYFPLLRIQLYRSVYSFLRSASI